jgi:chemotaxis protein methyltransferase CheR
LQTNNNFDKIQWDAHFKTIHLSDKLFLNFRSFIYNRLGINIQSVKKMMLQARLSKRLKHLNMKSYEEYYNYLTSDNGLAKELPNLINVVTTNKTDFFREPKHFDFLINKILPEYYHKNMNQIFRIWSAGCSTGAEPYTMAIVLKEFSHKNNRFKFLIHSTDISTKVLEIAKYAIYDHEMADPIPMELRKKYLLKRKNEKNPKQIRMSPEIRNCVQFQRLNLMDNDYNIKTPMDVIFCRNVIIYFDKKTQECVVNRLCQYLKPNGYLFMGHSESLHMIDAPIKNISSTVYKKIG